MRNVPGWVVGAAGAGVIAAAFFLGGRLAASDVTPLALLEPEVAAGIQLECEPGQRAVIRNSGSFACVGASVAPIAPIGSMQPASYVQPAVSRPPVAPRAPAVTPRASVAKTRSTRKSVAIIAGSTAAGAVVGGVAKGKKGAVIGGIVGGAAATIWDQVTRRRSDRDRGERHD